jgi:GTP-binding protein
LRCARRCPNLFRGGSNQRPSRAVARGAKPGCMPFLDEAKIHVRSGAGGRGCISFRREKFRPKGGPDGGDGGRGGDVVIEASSQVQSLLDYSYKKHFQAGSGKHGEGNDRHGADGEDLVLRVPVGTLVRDAQSGEVLADLTHAGQRVVVAKGGHGGKGNARFATPTRQAPRFSTPPGTGEERWVLLELKLMADVGLVGLPNVGKSSLLARVSSARPKIASYPFTTLNPHLGVVELGDEERMVMADLPGLVEGAHKGVGLGLRFLRHVERTRLLLYVLDLDPNRERGPVEEFQILRHEVQMYQPSLLQRPCLVALNKVDLPGASLRAREIHKLLSKESISCYQISALTGQGVEELLGEIFMRLKNMPVEKGEEREGGLGG